MKTFSRQYTLLLAHYISQEQNIYIHHHKSS